AEWRYVYRAREDVWTDDLKARAGDQLLLDVPSAETLRGVARAAREQGGTNLLGLCLFRLPGADGTDDPTALTLTQIATALTDTPAELEAEVRLESDAEPDRSTPTVASLTRDAGGTTAAGGLHHLRVSAANSGAAGALLGADSFTLTLRVPAGSVRGIASLKDFADAEILCSAVGSTKEAFRPCGPRRADAVRMRAIAWPPGATAQATLTLAGPLPARLQALVHMRADDGRAWRDEQTLPVNRKGAAR
ncbi:MAG: hypothetical protein ACRD9R_18380, partial [Pyrinomonadaceae bacterium]